MNPIFRTAMFLASTAIPILAQVAQVAVINYSGFNASAPIAPGSIASAYGSFGTVATTVTSTPSPLPTALAGISLRINNRNAPLYFVSSGQINFVVPNANESGAQTVEVLNGSTVIARGSVNIWEAFPAMASSDTTATSQGIVQNQNFSINNQSSRAGR